LTHFTEHTNIEMSCSGIYHDDATPQNSLTIASNRKKNNEKKKKSQRHLLTANEAVGKGVYANSE